MAPIILERFKEKGHKIQFYLSSSNFDYDFTRTLNVTLSKLDKKDGELIHKGEVGQGSYQFRIHLKSLDAFKKLMNNYPLNQTKFLDRKGKLVPKMKMIDDACKIIQSIKSLER